MLGTRNKCSMTAIEAVKRRMDKENEWNEEKNKKLKGYLLKGLGADHYCVPQMHQVHISDLSNSYERVKFTLIFFQTSLSSPSSGVKRPVSLHCR